VLTKRIGLGNPVDAKLVENVFVGPFGEAWVRFYPYVSADYENWDLEIRPIKGRSGPKVELPQPRTGWPARVLIESAQNPGRRTLPVRRLPDVLFPPFVTATDSLQAVLLDVVPNWDEARRTAFSEWLYRGGTVYVLNDANGNAPVFPVALGVLNSPLEVSSHGAGRIIRVPRSRFELTPESLTGMFAVLPKRLVQDYDGETKELSAIDTDQDSNDEPRAKGYQDGSDPISSSSFLARLRGMTRPKHNWALLHLLFWTYIGLVFPGCYLLGRKWADYRIVYGSLRGVVCVFSVLFAVVGQRGYGESTAVHSIAIARPLPDGQLDVSQWSNAFVTMGGNYDFRHQGQGTIYSTCNINEQVNGSIYNGAEARFEVDIPPFSSREFALRMKVKAPLPALTLEESEVAGDRLRRLVISIDDKFPQNTEQLLALYGNRFYQLSRNGRQLVMVSEMGTAPGFLRVQEMGNYAYQYGVMYDQHDRPVIDQFRDMFTPLIARSLNVSRAGDAEALNLPPQVVRVFFFGPMPPELTVQNRYLGRNEGWTLYAVDLPIQTK